ncbi:hypothetical protein ACNKHX_13780 [Shigella flexneri]
MTIVGIAFSENYSVERDVRMKSAIASIFMNIASPSVMSKR